MERKGAMARAPASGVARMEQAGEDDQPAMEGLRDEWHGRRRHDVGDGRQLLGRGRRRSHEAGHRLGRGGQDEHAPRRRLQGVQLEAEAGDDAEVAATTTDGPEEVGVRLRVHEADLAVGRHELRAEERVDGQAVLAHEVAEAPRHGEAPDAHRACVPEGNDQAKRGRHPREPDGGPAGTHPGRLAGGVEVERGQVAQVQLDATVRRAVPGRAVTAGTYGQLKAGLSREVHDDGHVLRVRRTHDDGGAMVVAGFRDGAQLVVVAVVRPDDPAGHLAPEALDGQAGGTGWLHVGYLLVWRSGRRTQYASRDPAVGGRPARRPAQGCAWPAMRRSTASRSCPSSRSWST